jgi:hypothetical protein
MTEFYFKILSPQDSEFEVSMKALRNVLDPIYGENVISQLVHKLVHNNDRVCEIYYENSIPKGLIIFKNFLSNEYADWGVKNGYEQKTTLPMIPEDRTTRLAMRKKIMERLLHRAANNALQMNAECFFGTVNEVKGGTLKLLFRLGFELVHTFKDKFHPGVDEYLIVHKNINKLYEETQG